MGLDQDHALLGDAAEASLEQVRKDLAEAKGRPQQVLAHLQDFLFDPGLDVKQLRRVCGISARSVSGEFAKAVGTPLAIYVREKRLETAKRLLRHTALPVSKISDLVGYDQPQSFSRAFTEWNGSSPTASRLLVKKSSRLRSVPSDKMLDKEFMNRVMLGQIDKQEEEQVGHHLQAVYPRTFSPNPPGQNSDSEPRLERVDGREWERIKAIELWREIAEQPLEQQRQRVCQVAFHTKAFSSLLLRKSREEGRKDRQRGVDIALLALDSLDTSVGAGLLGDDPRILRAQAWAWVGNARRLALGFPGAEQAFDRAEIELGQRFGRHPQFVKAEILLCRGALRLDQRCFQEALVLADRAVPIFCESDDLHRYLEARIFRARVLCYTGDAMAIEELGETLRDLAKKPQRRLELTALLLLAISQALDDQHQLARATVDRAKVLAVGFSSLSVYAHLDWVDALVAGAEGALADAETLLTSAREAFGRCGEIDSRVGVALDLAILHDRQGRYSEVKEFVAEALPVLEAFKFEGEVSKALALLKKAAAHSQPALESLLLARAAIQMVLRLPPTIGE